MILVINALGGVHTDTNTMHKSDFTKSDANLV